MPNNISPLDVGAEIRHLHNRLSRIENSPQVGHQSILNGSLDILDSTGRVLMVLGLQPDGTIGVASYDPVTGTKQAQMGQQTGGLYGLSVLNAASSQTQLVTGTASASSAVDHFTSSTTLATFGDEPTVTATIGASGQAVVTFGAYLGTGGDSDAGRVQLMVDGASAGVHTSITLSSSAAAPVAANLSRTIQMSGLAAGSHSFSMAYLCTSGVHGITVGDRFVTVSAL